MSEASEEALLILDKYLGELIESIVYRHRYNVDLDDEYEELLKFIYKRLVKAWFGGRHPAPSELERSLRNARRRRKQLEVLLSYLVSRYAARNGPIYLPQSRDWSDEYY